MIEKLWQTPEVYRIPVPLPENPLRTLNCYVVRSKGETLVIDTGFNRPECTQALWQGLGDLHVEAGDCTLFLTHLHSDHIGLAEIFTKAGAPVYMSKIDYDYFCRTKTGDNWAVLESIFAKEGFPPEEMEKQLTGNQARLYAPTDIFPAITVADGFVLTVGDLRFRCIHTPGHSPGHMCLYEQQQQLLFSGDHVLFDITPNITVWRDVPDSLANYLDSVKKMMGLPVIMTFPGHRAPSDELDARLQSLIHHHEHRLKEIQEVYLGDPTKTAYEIAGSIQWSMRGLTWAQFPPNQKWFAMGETLSHLVYLRNTGRI